MPVIDTNVQEICNKLLFVSDTAVCDQYFSL